MRRSAAWWRQGQLSRSNRPRLQVRPISTSSPWVRRSIEKPMKPGRAWARSRAAWASLRASKASRAGLCRRESATAWSWPRGPSGRACAVVPEGESAAALDLPGPLASKAPGQGRLGASGTRSFSQVLAGCGSCAVVVAAQPASTIAGISASQGGSRQVRTACCRPGRWPGRVLLMVWCVGQFLATDLVGKALRRRSARRRGVSGGDQARGGRNRPSMSSRPWGVLTAQLGGETGGAS